VEVGINPLAERLIQQCSLIICVNPRPSAVPFSSLDVLALRVMASFKNPKSVTP
jgi:hypothetical protein